jgi:hypothetical protein
MLWTLHLVQKWDIWKEKKMTVWFVNSYIDKENEKTSLHNMATIGKVSEESRACSYYVD